MEFIAAIDDEQTPISLALTGNQGYFSVDPTVDVNVAEVIVHLDKDAYMSVKESASSTVDDTKAILYPAGIHKIPARRQEKAPNTTLYFHFEAASDTTTVRYSFKKG